MLKTNRTKTRRLAGAALLLGGAAALSGCHIDMWDQPLHKPYYENDFFSDRSELRPVIPNTVPRAGSIDARLDDAYVAGRDAAGKFVPKIPARAVRFWGEPKAMLLRGQDRFNAYCSPCHGYIGDGNGMISQRGLGYWQKLPASYYTDRLRKVEDGYIYDVLVNGHGVMYGYGSRISDINDRWAVVSYIRALQLAHGANPAVVPPDVLRRLQGQKPVQENGGEPALGGTTGNSAEHGTVLEGTMPTERQINRTPGGANPGLSNGSGTAPAGQGAAGGGSAPAGGGGSAAGGGAR